MARQSREPALTSPSTARNRDCALAPTKQIRVLSENSRDAEGGSMTELSVRCETIKETPRSFRLEAGPDWWSSVRDLFRDPDAKLVSPLVAEFEAYRLGARLLFRGRIPGDIPLPCSARG